MTWKEKLSTIISNNKQNHDDPVLSKLHVLFYTEDDLPHDYYQEFARAFTKPQYRGFWTWKPWILTNLTGTAVFQPGDVVFWMDSDEQLRLTDDNSLHPYVYTVFCNIEHRNTQNYGGIYPFQRCFGHEEWKYTKPDVFTKLNVDPKLYQRGEQIYGGSFGFKVSVNNDTVQFLQEWLNYGHDPLLFGNDQDLDIHTTIATGRLSKTQE